MEPNSSKNKGGGSWKGLLTFWWSLGLYKGCSIPILCQDPILHKGNPNKAQKYQRGGKDEKGLHKDQSLIKKTGRKTYQNLKNWGSVVNGQGTGKIGHSMVKNRGREIRGPEMEPQLSLSAVPNGHLAVWDGRDGADVLHLAVPNFSPRPASLSLFKIFPRRVLWFWPWKERRCLGFVSPWEGERSLTLIGWVRGSHALIGGSICGIQGPKSGQSG